MKTILVTGAAGFIGSHLVEKLLQNKENRVRLVVAPFDSLKNLPFGTYEICVADIRDKNSLKNIVKGVDVVYHLAALTMKRHYTEKDYFDTNAQGTENLLEVLKKERIKKFVFFSSIAVFGLPAYVGDMNNLGESAEKKAPEVYGQSKLKAEHILQEYHKKYKIPYTIIRPTTVYGPKDTQNLAELYQVINKGMFFLLGSTRNMMDYVYVKDLVAGAILAANTMPVATDYILGGGKPHSLREIGNGVAKSIHKSIPQFSIPLPIALAAAYVMSHTFKAFGKVSPIFPDRVRVMTRNCYFSIKKARKEKGYKP